MNVYEETDYKRLIRMRTKEVAKRKKGLTFQRLAACAGIQNTYLSRALNDESTHLNEDCLFKICRELELFADEIDFVFLLRAHALAADEGRREHVESKINRLRAASQRSADFQEFDRGRLEREMAYLFDPMAAVVHLALFVPAFRENPRRLCGPLGISPARLKEMIRAMADLDFVETGADALDVRKVSKSQIHYGTDHPLMRTHQNLRRSRCASHAAQAPEQDKLSFMATFSADPEAFETIKARFRTFMKDVEAIVGPSTSKGAYQLNFDLFKWLEA